MKFSVLMSVYGKETVNNFISAMDSVINQTLVPTEVIIVKDGPLYPELEGIIQSYTLRYKNLLKIISLKENKGLGYALARGLEACSYNVIARMDTDDICYPSRFEEQITFMLAHPQISALGTCVQEFNKIPGDLNQFRTPPLNYIDIRRFSKFRNPLNHPSVVFKKAHVLNAGSYQHMPLFEDYFLWIRMLQLGYKIENLKLPLLHFRIGNDMIGRRHGLNYMKKELTFLLEIKRLGFINSVALVTSILLKFPLRLLPKSLLKFVYKKTLR